MGDHVDELIAAQRARLDKALGPVTPEGDITAAVAELSKVLRESETIEINFDPELRQASVSMPTPYSSVLGPYYQARSITDALRKAISARKNEA